MQTQTKGSLQQADSVCQTVDRQMLSYIGITAHYIHEWEMSHESVMLACSRFQSRHTGTNILSEFDSVVDKFDIRGKITNVLTENTSNMIAAFNLPGFTEDTSDDEEDAGSDELIPVNEDSDEEEDSSYLLHKRCNPCFPHTLQLSIKDAFKNYK